MFFVDEDSGILSQSGFHLSDTLSVSSPCIVRLLLLGGFGDVNEDAGGSQLPLGITPLQKSPLLQVVVQVFRLNCGF